MRFYQMEYTSCRVGRHGGFQVRAATPGVYDVVGEAEMDEILRLGLYRQPEDPQEAPVAFRAVRLQSGRQLVQYSRYLGRDDTGREGNFRTRSLVAARPGESLPLWAMDFYEWPGWNVPSGGDLSGGLPELPFAELGTVGGDSFAYPELAQFVREQRRRAEWLRTLLATLFLPPAARRVVIRDEKVNNPYWLACLTKLLPMAVANSLSLSTFQSDGAGFDLLGAPACSALPRAASVLTPEAPEPLLRPGSLPPLPESGKAYARRVTELLLLQPKAVPGFLLELQSLIRSAD